MASGATTVIGWPDGALDLLVEAPADAPVRITRLSTHDPSAPPAPARLQPLVELFVLGEGHMLSNTRFTHTAVGARLRYTDHATSTVDGWTELRVTQRDEVTGLATVSVLRGAVGVPAVRSWTEVTNTGTGTHVLQMVTSFAAGAVLEPGEDAADLSLLSARSEWCAENRWTVTRLRGTDGLPEINTTLHDHDGRGSLATVSRSTWSSGEHLPTGIVRNDRTGRSWAWQIEHNGAWHQELDTRREGVDALALVLTGPNDLDHQWAVRLAPGESFTTVPVAIAVSGDGHEGAIAAMTAHRRALRTPHPADDSLPVVFNDYMNTLMGDPTTGALLPLVDAAAAVGAEYFCIDAGWYDDGGAWWDSVGEWQPSTGRFPDGGLDRVLDHIRSRGMRPGLWLEPEVVGVRSPVADTLLAEAFLQRFGQRVVEHSRYHLDLRHPAAREHLDSVVDRLVGDHGIGFFKLDYNVTPGTGTDLDALSPGAGLLDHNRAHLDWLDGILARHPSVIFENCASGAMRTDYAMLSRLQLQSTSDQQDPRLYPAIAAAAPASILPEQAGNWAYPQPGMDHEALAHAMVNGLLGRLYLSGHLDRMDDAELALVREGVQAHQRIRADMARAVPSWPLGLPGWFDDRVALALHAGEATHLAVWNRGPGADAIDLRLPGLRGRQVRVDTTYPTTLTPWETTWDAATGVLTVVPAVAGPGARLLRLTALDGAAE